MMQPQFQVVKTRMTPLPGRPAERGRLLPALSAALVLLGLGGALAWSLHRQLGEFLGALDGESLDRAHAVLERSVEQQRRYLLSEVGVLADDTRVRASVMTPDFSEATVKDTLQDLKAASGASVLAVLDLGGKVRAVTGAEALQNVDLGSSPLVKQAAEKPAAYVWTFADRVLIVGAAPIHSGAESSALFMMAFELGNATLASLREMLDVEGAVLIGDRVVASSATSPALTAAFRAAATLDEDTHHLVQGASDAETFVARVARTSQSASAGKVVLLVPHRHHVERAGLLRIMAWMPGLLGALAFALVLALVRHRQNGDKA